MSNIVTYGTNDMILFNFNQSKKLKSATNLVKNATKNIQQGRITLHTTYTFITKSYLCN